MAPLHQKHSLSERQSTSGETVTVEMLVHIFLTFKLQSTEKIVWNINPSYIQKNLDTVAGKVKNASHLKNGILLVEVYYCCKLISLDRTLYMLKVTHPSTPPKELSPLILWMGWQIRKCILPQLIGMFQKPVVWLGREMRNLSPFGLSSWRLKYPPNPT
jgi:hypothetical protein